MEKTLPLLILVGLTTTPTFAQNSKIVTLEQPTEAQIELTKAAAEAKERTDKDAKRLREKDRKGREALAEAMSGKPPQKKASQQSEKKWWQFWAD